uniref:Uncharacterized protein n=1 Tax=Arundo donax TaxID=35708 RepID=A0A0A9EZN2_ARUDO
MLAYSSANLFKAGTMFAGRYAPEQALFSNLTLAWVMVRHSGN